MKVYRVEMKQKGTWRIGRVPLGSLHGNRATKEQAIKDAENMRKRWDEYRFGKQMPADMKPTEWRIMVREETDWTVCE